MRLNAVACLLAILPAAFCAAGNPDQSADNVSAMARPSAEDYGRLSLPFEPNLRRAPRGVRLRPSMNTDQQREGDTSGSVLRVIASLRRPSPGCPPVLLWLRSTDCEVRSSACAARAAGQDSARASLAAVDAPSAGVDCGWTTFMRLRPCGRRHCLESEWRHAGDSAAPIAPSGRCRLWP